MSKKISEVVEQPTVEVTQEEPKHTAWIYGTKQPENVQIGEAYVHICNPHEAYLNIRTWCEVRIKKADNAYKKVILTEKSEAQKIAHTYNRSNGIIKDRVVTL